MLFRTPCHANCFLCGQSRQINMAGIGLTWCRPFRHLYPSSHLCPSSGDASCVFLEFGHHLLLASPRLGPHSNEIELRLQQQHSPPTPARIRLHRKSPRMDTTREFLSAGAHPRCAGKSCRTPSGLFVITHLIPDPYVSNDLLTMRTN